MLKIKDNINLKELEKYGFKDFSGGKYYMRYGDVYSDDLIFDIWCSDRILQIETPLVAVFEKFPDFIFDMIKDGIVEKVSDD